MSRMCLVLHTINGQVFCEVGKDYLLYIGECETIAQLTPSQIVLLVNATIADHMGPHHVH